MQKELEKLPETLEALDPKEWIIKNQLGRRNLTEQEASYYRGKLYESRKRQGARTDLTLAQNGTKLSTADIIGMDYGVSKNTVKRDAEFSAAVDKVATEVGEEAKRAILSGKANVPKKDVEKLIEIKQEAPEYIDAAFLRYIAYLCNSSPLAQLSFAAQVDF